MELIICYGKIDKLSLLSGGGLIWNVDYIILAEWQLIMF
jgi:hypothetical protein